MYRKIMTAIMKCVRKMQGICAFLFTLECFGCICIFQCFFYIIPFTLVGRWTHKESHLCQTFILNGQLELFPPYVRNKLHYYYNERIEWENSCTFLFRFITDGYVLNTIFEKISLFQVLISLWINNQKKKNPMKMMKNKKKTFYSY